MPEFDLDAALTNPDPDGLAWSGAARWRRTDSNEACRAGWDIFYRGFKLLFSADQPNKTIANK